MNNVLYQLLFLFFFFSSRRRHTRLQGDWSSDVCSSDLSDLAVGSPGNGAGSVTTFHRTDKGWEFLQLLLPSDSQAGSQFGYSVSISGTALAAGAPEQGNSGAVYLYVKSGDDDWLPDPGTPFGDGRLMVGDVARGARFGFSVALSGDTLVVSAAFDGVQGSISGSVYVFRKRNGQWQQE